MSSKKKHMLVHGIKPLIAMFVLAICTNTAAAEPPLPLQSGQYTFKHRYAEQPNMPSLVLTAKIRGHHIVLINRRASEVFPKGVIAEGTLMWHVASKQWIIGTSKDDRYARDVGGCSDGPDVVDLRKKIYWTC